MPVSNVYLNQITYKLIFIEDRNDHKDDETLSNNQELKILKYKSIYQVSIDIDNKSIMLMKFHYFIDNITNISVSINISSIYQEERPCMSPNDFFTQVR